MREDAEQRATEFLKELYAVGDIDASRFDAGLTGLLAARTEAELAEVVRSLPAPVALTSADRRLAEPLEIRSGMGRLRLAGRWQVGRETHISADLGSVTLDLTEAEFDDRIIDLHVYSGCHRQHRPSPPASSRQPGPPQAVAGPQSSVADHAYCGLHRKAGGTAIFLPSIRPAVSPAWCRGCRGP